jgi:hypothetical protein
MLRVATAVAYRRSEGVGAVSCRACAYCAALLRLKVQASSGCFRHCIPVASRSNIKANAHWLLVEEVWPECDANMSGFTATQVKDCSLTQWLSISWLH